MKVVIGGCGRVGALLSARLSLEGNEIAIIDQDPEALERLGSSFKGSTHVGKVFDRDTLVEAGIDHADAYVAVTSGDNSNIVSTLVAKEEFLVPRVLARIYDPRRAEIYRRLGVPAVSSVAWSVNEIFTLLAHPGVVTDLAFGDGEVRLVSVECPLRLVGRRVGELLRSSELELVVIVRAGRSFLPTDGATLAEHDILHFVVTGSALEHLERMLHP